MQDARCAVTLPALAQDGAAAALANRALPRVSVYIPPVAGEHTDASTAGGTLRTTLRDTAPNSDDSDDDDHNTMT